MRKLKGIRKLILIEEAWKAIASANMADYIRYLYKTVRKYFGEAIVVTQEIEDIISSPIVKESIINNSDCKILLDQRKYLNKFDSIQNLLGLTDKERSQILSINMANHPGRKYKEVFFSLGGTQSAVYATEVSLEEYYTYTTEESEKWNCSPSPTSWEATLNWLSSGLQKAKEIPNHQQLKIRNMKWIDNLIYTLLSACLLAGCEDSGSKELERMQGYWVHVRGHPAFTLSETGGRYTVTRKANVRGRILETAYPVTERNGCLFIETGFRIQFTYDKRPTG